MTKLLSALAILVILFSCNNKELKPEVSNNTLLIFTEGKLINYNIDSAGVSWEYQSPKDTEDNRNYFVISENTIYAPFESGAFIAFDVRSGKELWEYQIYGNGDNSDGISGAFEAEDGSIITEEEYEYNQSGGRGPLFMSKPMVFADKVYMLSTGRVYEAQGAAYAFDKATGEKLWITNLPYTHNYYSPVNDGEYLYVNSAILLHRLGLKTGMEYSMGLDQFDFEVPLYNQMVCDTKRVVLADERGQVFSLNFSIFEKLQDLLGDSIGYAPLSRLSEEQKRKVFEWTFKDNENESSYISEDLLYMDDDYVYFFAETNSVIYFYKLDKKNGKLQLKKEVSGNPLNYAEFGNSFMGYTQNEIFSIKKKSGEPNYQIPIQDGYQPISNIEEKDKDELIYLCKEGIVQLNTNTKEFKFLDSGLTFKGGEHNYTQIQYLRK